MEPIIWLPVPGLFSQEVEEEMQRRNQSKKLELGVADLRLQQTALRKDASRQQDLTQARTAIRSMASS